jgi:hypothetical protein
VTVDPALATLAVAAVALLVGVVTVWQRWAFDRRDALWQRSQWAIDRSLSPDPVQRSLGTEVVSLLLDSGDLTDDDRGVLVAAAEHAALVGEVDDAGDDEVFVLQALEQGAPAAGRRVAPRDTGPAGAAGAGARLPLDTPANRRRARISAARAIVKGNDRLGRPTHPAVIALARAPVARPSAPDGGAPPDR